MSKENILLRSINSFFVGGSIAVTKGLPVEYRSTVLNGAPREVNHNGEHLYGQMYVQEFRLSKPLHSNPVLLWHGGGMTGCTWETTPDGRPGWLWKFLEAGYDVLVCDAVERGRSSWAMYPTIYKENPIFRTKEEGWINFRIGPLYDVEQKKRSVYAGQRFPVEHFDYFANQWVPRWPGHEEMILSAYEALIKRVGNCHLVAHSQGAGFAAEIAKRQANAVKSVVCIEPGGVPTADFEHCLPPHLVVWGDYIKLSGTHWVDYRKQADIYFNHIARFTRVHLMDLPAEGIYGNSHLPMLDTNSDEIFELVRQWLSQQ